jgi:hypothetical protein
MFTSLVFLGAYRRHDVRHRALFAAQLWTTVRNSCSRLELKWLNRTVAVQVGSYGRAIEDCPSSPIDKTVRRLRVRESLIVRKEFKQKSHVAVGDRDRVGDLHRELCAV